MSVATFEDVKVRFHHELTDEDRPLVEQRLRDVEGMIRARIPDLDDRIFQNPYLGDIVVRVSCDAIIRLMTNPDGYMQETDGNYTYMLQNNSNNGRLAILPEEWIDLGVRRGVRILHAMPLQAGGEYEPFR